MPAPLIYTERLLLRPFDVRDAAAYSRLIFSDPQVMRYMNATGTVPRAPLAHAMTVIGKRQVEWDERGYSAWALMRVEDSAFMGHVGFFIIDGTRTVELGYALGRAYWGQGYATEAARAALDYAFRHTSLTEIVALAFPQNAASLQVMKKVGMQRRGRTTDYYDLALEMYSIDREDYLSQISQT